jgi:hypothetical protein
MNTRRFKINCDKHFVGFIFISDNNPHYPDCKVGLIWPFGKKGKCTPEEMEQGGQMSVHDIYDIKTTDEEIQNDLIKRANIDTIDCKHFEITRVKVK